MSLFEEHWHLYAEEVEKALSETLPAAPKDPSARLIDAMRYSLLGGGKRIRAFLAMEFCTLCGADRRHALPYAAALEMIQAFSLIHDDLPCMDNDVLRRGKPTNHVAFGESTALLAGDALSIHAFGIAAANPLCGAEQNALAVQVLAAASGEIGMCGGQQMDLDGEHQKLDAEVLEQLVSRKTGALFSASCELGCIAAGATEEQRAASRTYAVKTGLAFQIADDLLDLHATAEQLGKTPGKDAASEKNTFPALLGEQAAAEKARRLCLEAKEALAVFPRSEAREALEGYCDFVLDRSF